MLDPIETQLGLFQRLINVPHIAPVSVSPRPEPPLELWLDGQKVEYFSLKKLVHPSDHHPPTNQQQILRVNIANLGWLCSVSRNFVDRKKR